jgi:lysophospholipase L1-like esterase
MNLQYELDYLIPRMKSYFLTTNYETDWKMVTLQIGSNDQCASCNSTITDHVTPTAYGQYVEAAIQRIKTEIPKVVVNLRKIIGWYITNTYTSG